MNRTNIRRLLNAVMAVGLVLLATAGLGVWNNNLTQAAYDELADRRKFESDQKIPQTEEVLLTPPVRNDPLMEESEGIPELPLIPNPNDKWLEINPDYAGWLTVPGTAIDYPYVRSRDNADYLIMDFYRKPAKAGTVFMDYRNLGNFKDRHLVLYGHNMKNGTMFHDLVRYHDRKFFDSHREISVSGLYETRRFRIFSVYEITATDTVIPLHFESDRSLEEEVKLWQKQSMHPEEQPVEGGSILSLVTCSYGIDNGRTIVHAVEITQP